MKIEAASPRDLPDIQRLLLSVALPVEGAEERLGTTLVAWEDSGLAGTAALELYAEGALLRSVAVEPGLQGRRIGHHLTQAALRLARERGVPVVFLLTTTAEHFFPKLGFERITREDVPESVKASDEFGSASCASAVVMRKLLIAHETS